MRERFGTDRVFIDIEALQPGVDFVEGLEREIGRCEVLLVVMGRNWLSMAGPTGERRIDEPNDFVRLEIEAALERGIRVIPVLVEGAVMPEPSDLPESIASLARRQAVEVRNAPSYFAFDVGRLIQSLDAIITASPAGRLALARASGRRRRLLTVAGAAGAVVAAAAVAVVIATSGSSAPQSNSTTAQSNSTTAQSNPSTPRAASAKATLLSRIPADVRSSCVEAHSLAGAGPQMAKVAAEVECKVTGADRIGYAIF
ncbi:MAG: toll/interleukin-1 receptor domain-containing protein, partial [Solirubrobacteraceae bacterium]